MVISSKKVLAGNASTSEKNNDSAVENTRQKRKRKRQIEDDDDDDEEEENNEESNKSDEEEEEGIDSDTIDMPRKSVRANKSRNRKKSNGTTSKRKRKDIEVDLDEGEELVGVVVQAPKTGLVPAGQVSQNTLDFLTHLRDLKRNNRAWFKLHEPLYRTAEKEWKAFIETFTDLLIEVDPQIPHLPPKDVIHRIYRDVRFSNDKTPYKRNLSASFSRSGRKGKFAGYHISIKPGDESLIAAGLWCPQRSELATIRTNIQRNSQPLRDVISSPEFIKHFGEPEPSPGGDKRNNIFGAEDELKTAPKGVSRDHKDIDLLKCRSFAVMYRFSDSEVLSDDFKSTLADVARVLQPFVHCLNGMLTI